MEMDPGARAAFVAAYGRLVTNVWSDPEQELLLEHDPRALMAQHGLALQDAVRIEVVRDVHDAEPDLDAQVAAWESAPESGQFVLVVPSVDVDDEIELAEHELDGIVAGMDTSCACCCPCCCST
jgi:hypothetical protein